MGEKGKIWIIRIFQKNIRYFIKLSCGSAFLWPFLEDGLSGSRLRGVSANEFEDFWLELDEDFFSDFELL